MATDRLHGRPHRAESMRFEGTLTAWNDDRGFGFIEAEQGGEPIFAHIKAFTPASGRPSVGMRVSFEVESGPKGKRAKRVQPLRRHVTATRVQAEAPAPWGTVRLAAIPALLVIYFVVAKQWPVSPLWLAAYAVMSIVTFFAYAFDKAAAVRKTWRTSERALHALGFLCGWPGALLAQQALRHKTSKPSFRVVFWLTVAANLATFIAFNTPFGKHLLERGAV